MALLNTFSCERNSDVEHFLRAIAISNEKSSKSRTYLIVPDNLMPGALPKILAYFSVSLHIMSVSGDVPESKKRRLSTHYEPRIAQDTACYLIGQIGKNDGFKDMITGEEILHFALGIITSAHDKVGGRFVKVDCEPIQDLMRFYAAHDFEFIQKNDRSGLNELVHFF